MIAWIKRKLREQREEDERFDAAMHEIAHRYDGATEWEFTPQNDITALELGLVLKSMTVPARSRRLLHRVILRKGVDLDPSFARHFSLIGPYTPEN